MFDVGDIYVLFLKVSPPSSAVAFAPAIRADGHGSLGIFAAFCVVLQTASWASFSCRSSSPTRDSSSHFSSRRTAREA